MLTKGSTRPGERMRPSGTTPVAGLVTQAVGQHKSSQRKIIMKYWSLKLVYYLSIILIANGCGGGGGDTQSVPPQDTTSTVQLLVVLSDTTSDLDSTPDEGILSRNVLLRDGDKETNALFLASPWVNLNLGIRVNRQPVDGLLLYTSYSTEFADWSIYTSTDGTNWALLTNSITPIYNELFECFELKFPEQTTDYIKVIVSYLGSDSSIYFTEIEAYNIMTVEN